MHCFLTPRWLRLLQIACIGVPLLWWGLCYFFWIERGCRPFLPFVSDFDLQEPEDTIFTVGLSLTSLILLVRTLQLYLVQNAWLSTHGANRGWIWLNRFGLLPGGIGILALAGLARVPWNEDVELHLVLADTIFLSGILWCVCMTLLTWYRSRETPSLETGLRWRFAGSVVAASSLLGMHLTAGLELADEDYDLAGRIALSFSDPLAHCVEASAPAMNHGAAFEWVLIFGILFVIWTFDRELREGVVSYE